MINSCNYTVVPFENIKLLLLYADKLCRPIAECIEVKDQPIMAVNLLASTSLSTAHIIGSISSRATSSGF